MKTTLTVERIREILSYNPDTGVLSWKVRPLSDFRNQRLGTTWNTRYAGKVAGSLTKAGYIRIGFGRLNLKAHRVIFAIITGEMPQEVDHKNGNRGDNRWQNLRSATDCKNAMNTKIRSDNKSGVKGVSETRPGIWAVQVHANRKAYRSLHKSKQEAVAKAQALREKLHGEFACHGIR